MTARELAKHYARYCSGQSLPDNAPAELRQLVAAYRTYTDTRLILQAVKRLAGTATDDEPITSVLFEFMADRPAARLCMDEILRSKTPPKDHEDLLRRAYAAHTVQVGNIVRNWLRERLDQ